MATNPKDKVMEMGDIECVMYGLVYGHITPIRTPWDMMMTTKVKQGKSYKFEAS
jgi:hypothetical protein